MRVFKTKAFARFARRERIADWELRDAIRRVEGGLLDADLGSGVVKQRIAREGEGRSGGFRSVILYRRGSLAFFVHGFAKSDRDNIRRHELTAFRRLADVMLALDREALAAAVNNGTITEIEFDG